MGYQSGDWDVTPRGEFTYSIPLEVPPGRAGMQPALSLEYSSGVGNGAVGMGWSLSGLSGISRCAKTIATEGVVEAHSRFCLGGNKLISLAGEYGADGTEYRTELETYSQIFSYGGSATGPDAGPEKFVVRAKGGRISEYLVSPELSMHGDTPVREQWRLASETDRSGNRISYSYDKVGGSTGSEGAETILKRIDYSIHPSDTTAHRYIEFTYEARPDKEFSWSHGVRTNLSQRLSKITMFAPNPTTTGPVWTYRLRYDTSPGSGRSRLSSVQQCGTTSCRWKKEFEWYAVPAVPSWTDEYVQPSLPVYASAAGRMRVLDMDADGADDLLYDDGSVTGPQLIHSRHGLNATFDLLNHVEAASLPAFPPDTPFSRIQPVDIDGDGASELFIDRKTALGPGGKEQCQHRVVRFNRTASVFQEADALADLSLQDTHECGSRETLFGDLDGDTLLDLVRKDFTFPLEPWYVPVAIYSAPEYNGPAPYFGFTPLGPLQFAVYPNAGGHYASHQFEGYYIHARVEDRDGDGVGDLSGRACRYWTPHEPRNCLSTLPGTPDYENGPPPPGGDFDDLYALIVTREGALYPESYEQNQGRYYLVADINGDGLQDSVSRFSGQAPYLEILETVTIDTLYLDWNTGRGMAAGTTIDLPWAAPYENISYVDLNRDGRTDILVAHDLPDVPGQPNSDFGALLSKGDGTFTVVDLPFKRAATWQPGDFNGDGHLDIAQIFPAGSPDDPDQIGVMLQVPHSGDRMHMVFDEATVWPREEITYSHVLSDKPEAPLECSYPRYCKPRGFNVTREVTSRAHLINPVDAMASGRTLYYSYEHPVVDRWGRGFAGFGTFRVWDPTRPMERVTTYDNMTLATMPSPNSIAGASFVYRKAMQPASVTTVVPLAAPVRRTGLDVVQARVTRTYASSALRPLHGGRTFDLVPTEWNSLEWEQPVKIDWAAIDPAPANPSSNHIFDPGLFDGEIPDSVAPLRSRSGSSEYDGYGNEHHAHWKTNKGRSITVDTEYENRLDTWLIGLPLKQTVTTSEGDPASGSVTRTTHYEFSSLGQVTEIHREKDHVDPSIRQTTVLNYDAWGVMTSMQSVPGMGSPRAINFEYAPWPGAPDEHIFLSQAWQPFMPLQWRPSIWMKVHPATGQAWGTMDENGVQTATHYDDLGRMVAAYADGSPPSFVSYGARLDEAGGFNGITIRSTVADQQVTLTMDALERTILDSSKGFDGSARHTAIEYDSLNRVASRSEPYAGTVPNHRTVSSYDPLDRLIESMLPDDSTVRYTHSFSEQQKIDPSGFESTATFDLDGRLVRTVNELRLNPGSPAVPVAMTYHYAADRLEVIDDQGNETRQIFDLLGRVLRQEDPDAGTTEFAYNGHDEIVESRHLESGETDAFEHDALGRMLSQTTSDGTTTLQWDTALNGIGRLDFATSPDNISTKFTYDGFGRTQGMEQVVDGKAYRIGRTYDAQGRLDELLYPSVDGSSTPGLRLKAGYNAAGYLDNLSYAIPGGTQQLWHANARTMRDTLAHARYGNGNVLMRTEQAETGRVQRLQVIKSGADPTALFDLTYSYHPNGLVESRVDAVVNRSERFDYDSLYRLRRWTSIYGGAVREVRNDYDTLGNLTHVWVDNLLTEENQYGTSGGGLPHALTQQTRGNLVTTASYDERGRQKRFGLRDISQYTSFDLPKTLTINGQAATLAYDAAGTRAKKTGPAGTTIYVDKLYERRESSGSVEHVFHVPGPDGAIAEITQVGPAGVKRTEYLIEDALGSAAAVTDDGGNVANRLFYEPFGLRIHPTGQPCSSGAPCNDTKLRNGFTGHEHDMELGLINMNGRVYDATLKRFLTPDPLISLPTFGQSWNPYSYVINSPLNFTDPTGYALGDGRCGGDAAGNFTSPCGGVSKAEEGNVHGGQGSVNQNTQYHHTDSQGDGGSDGGGYSSGGRPKGRRPVKPGQEFGDSPGGNSIGNLPPSLPQQLPPPGSRGNVLGEIVCDANNYCGPKGGRMFHLDYCRWSENEKHCYDEDGVDRAPIELPIGTDDLVEFVIFKGMFEAVSVALKARKLAQLRKLAPLSKESQSAADAAKVVVEAAKKVPSLSPSTPGNMVREAVSHMNALPAETTFAARRAFGEALLRQVAARQSKWSFRIFDLGGQTSVFYGGPGGAIIVTPTKTILLSGAEAAERLIIQRIRGVEIVVGVK